MMMNKKQTWNTGLSKSVFILTVVVICSLIFGITKAKESKALSTIISETLNTDLVSRKQDKENIDQDTTKKKESKKVTMEGIPEPIKIDEKLIPLIDTVENGAIDLTELRNSSKNLKQLLFNLTVFQPNLKETRYLL